MAFSTGALRLQTPSPIGGALAVPRVVVGDPNPLADTLTERLQAKLAEILARGFHIKWLEMSQAEMVTLFREAGEEVIRLDPDPAVDRGWYGEYEVRASVNTCIWIWIEGEIEGELSVHILD